MGLIVMLFVNMKDWDSKWTLDDRVGYKKIWVLFELFFLHDGRTLYKIFHNCIYDFNLV